MPKGYQEVDRTRLRGQLNDKSPIQEGLRSLLVKDQNLKGKRDAEEKTKPPVSKVKSISDVISNNIQANNDLRTITHYIKRAEQIWTTLLLKPNGEQRNLLIYDSDSSEIKNSKLHDILLQKLENHFTTKFPFEELIPQIIKEVLFRSGAYVRVNLTHAVLDHLINGMDVGGTESFNDSTTRILNEHFIENNWNRAKNLGYIRKERPNPGAFVGFESLYGQPASREPEFNLVHQDLKWTFTDNPLVLKVGELAQKLRGDRLTKMAGLESIDSAINNVFKVEKGKRRKVNNNHISIPKKKDLEAELDNLYPNRNYKDIESLSVRKGKFYTGNGRGVGIGFQWPTEGVINVQVNGDNGKPFGHILLTDPDTGEPLKNTSDVKFYQTARGRGGEGDTKAGSRSGSLNDIISHIRSVAQGRECTEDMSWMSEFTSATLEKEFIEAFLNGDLHKNVSISLTEENKKLFLSRALRDQGVRAIFVPAEYVTYAAVDFNHFGVGRSLVDEAKIHISRLAILDTANALAQVENAISHTDLEITPEEQDVDIRNTVAMVRDEYFAGNPTLHDVLGYNNVSIDAILDRFKEQSLTVKVNQSNNPHAITPEITARQSDREPLKSIDPDSRETLLNTIAGYFGLKRSWLEDTGEGNDFAIEALADQELLRNQTNDYSKTFSRFFTDMMRKYARANEPLIAELVEVIKENKTLYMKSDQTGDLEINDEAAEKINKEGDEDTEVDELEAIEIVLKDFLNTFFVSLPTPAVTDSLNKLDDRLDVVDKLVAKWTEMGGGVKMLKRRADEAGMSGDNVVDNVKAVLLNEAFERFNLPMPFESILNSGKSGGMMNYITKAADLDSNILRFLTDWLKVEEGNNKKLQKLKTKVDKVNTEESEVVSTDENANGDMNSNDGNNNPDDLFTDPSTQPEAEPTDNSEEENEETTTDDNVVEETSPEDSKDDLWDQ